MHCLHFSLFLSFSFFPFLHIHLIYTQVKSRLHCIVRNKKNSCFFLGLVFLLFFSLCFVFSVSVCLSPPLCPSVCLPFLSRLRLSVSLPVSVSPFSSSPTHYPLPTPLPISQTPTPSTSPPLATSLLFACLLCLKKSLLCACVCLCVYVSMCLCLMYHLQRLHKFAFHFFFYYNCVYFLCGGIRN